MKVYCEIGASGGVAIQRAIKERNREGGMAWYAVLKRERGLPGASWWAGMKPLVSSWWLESGWSGLMERVLRSKG